MQRVVIAAHRQAIVEIAEALRRQAVFVGVLGRAFDDLAAGQGDARAVAADLDQRAVGEALDGQAVPSMKEITYDEARQRLTTAAGERWLEPAGWRLLQRIEHGAVDEAEAIKVAGLANLTPQLRANGGLRVLLVEIADALQGSGWRLNESWLRERDKKAPFGERRWPVWTIAEDGHHSLRRRRKGFSASAEQARGEVEPPGCEAPHTGAGHP